MQVYLIDQSAIDVSVLQEMVLKKNLIYEEILTKQVMRLFIKTMRSNILVTTDGTQTDRQWRII